MKQIYSLLLCLGFSLVSPAQDDTSPPSFEVVGDYYSNNYSVFYPLGWSESGNLAYISQNVNGLSGAQIYSYNFAVTDHQGWGTLIKESTTYNLEIDTTLWSYHQEFSVYHDTTYFGYEFMKKVYWDFHKEHISKVMKHYKIKPGINKFMQPLSRLKEAGISIQITKESDSINVIRVDKKYSINIEYKGISKNVYSFYNPVDENGWTFDDWGNSVDLLYYQVAGYLKSPNTNNYFLYVHEVTMGFEEPAEKIFLIPFSTEK